ncbi:hypothetical protein Q0590_13770 [Rhodocytophaga aerolata]|uniref:Glycosyltransferase RgtA/B/C/D-like domain-containing protein n=1 Tax=Rhodocytophaga aerolata TaxID=455078 RepID=A0ABT8R5F6_9BACT|nr:hypothetical protein [Rhodocytophaga aerolata]MDO1447331.1 hypothetical protein [Rhodocytophaga aerolata]
MLLNTLGSIIERKYAKGKYRFYAYIAYCIIGIGFFLRVYHYLDNRSLWLEEAFLTYNFFHRSFIGLTQQPLEYGQQAPIGFLFIEKLFLSAFGKNEYALRLFPLICGTLALYLFYKVSTYFLTPKGSLIALFCFALSNPAIYHAVDVKQYSTELFSSVLIYYLYFYYKDKTDLASMIKWGLAGSSLIWFSYSAVFILAGVGLATIWEKIQVKKELTQLMPLFLTFAIWLISFFIVFILFASNGVQSSWLKGFWQNQGAFMPFPPNTIADLRWFAEQLKNIFDYPLAINFQYIVIPNYLRISIIGLFFFAAGLIYWFKYEKKYFIALVLPLVLTIVASGLTIYPFYERLILFLLPSLILIVIKGLETICKYIETYSTSFATLCIAIFLLPLVFNASYLAIFPKYIYNRIDTREALMYLKENIQKGDFILDNLNYQTTNGNLFYNEGPILSCYREMYPDIEFTTTIFNVDKNKNLVDIYGNVLVKNNRLTDKFIYTKTWVVMKTVTSISLDINEDGHEIRTNKSEYIVNLLIKAGGKITKDFNSQGVKVILVEFN